MTCGALVDFSMPSKNLIAGVAAGLCEKRDFKNGAGVNEWLAMGEEGRARPLQRRPGPFRTHTKTWTPGAGCQTFTSSLPKLCAVSGSHLPQRVSAINARSKPRNNFQYRFIRNNRLGRIIEMVFTSKVIKKKVGTIELFLEPHQ